jgi:hypothetical protein
LFKPGLGFSTKEDNLRQEKFHPASTSNQHSAFDSTALYSQSCNQLQEHPDGMEATVSLTFVRKLDAPGIKES